MVSIQSKFNSNECFIIQGDPFGIISWFNTKRNKLCVIVMAHFKFSCEEQMNATDDA